MSAVHTHESSEAIASDATTPMNAFIIDDDGFWVPSPLYDDAQTGQNDGTPPPPPPAPMPFSSLWPFILQETLCKGSPPFTLADRDAAAVGVGCVAEEGYVAVEDEGVKGCDGAHGVCFDVRSSIGHALDDWVPVLI